MLLKKMSFVLSILLFGLLILSACKDEGDAEPTATPNLDRAALAQTAFANPTNTPRSRETPTPLPDVESELALTTAQMELAIVAGDVDKYMENIWQGDPLFTTEQRRWAEAWAKQPPHSFDITLSSISAPSEEESFARMSVKWRGSGEAEVSDLGSGGSTITVHFYREAADSRRWLFAGEAWQVINLHRNGSDWTADQPSDGTEKIRIYYLPDYGPITGTSKAATVLAENIPGIYTIVSRELDIEPTEALNLKVYEYPDALRSMVDITYLHVLWVWNQPAEALRFSQDVNTELPPDDEVMAAQLVYRLLYQLADDTIGNYPQWVVEGTAQMLVMKEFMTVPRRNNQLSEMAGIVLGTAEGVEPEADAPQMQDWEAMAEWESEPSAQDYAAGLQAGTFVYYIDATYGQEKRNEWIKSMAAEKTLEEACQDILGKSFEDLTADWLAWIGTQA
ncbi:MAG: hypothetical protein F9K46_03285 [Anaerolineae bacterium]|nr:MAG: hypothetical protein F9K46_03285 [Anaerolineae bacterium]